MRRFKERILETAIIKLETGLKIVSAAAKDERGIAERLPGNLKQSQKYDKIIQGAGNLECAAKQIEYAICNIKKVIGIE